MLLVFVVGLTCADMLLLTLAFCQLCFNQGENQSPMLRKTMATVKVLGKISMLDVFIMGVIVISFAAGMYASMGVVFSLKSGIWILLGAECIHYFTFSLVSGACEQAGGPEALEG